MVMLQLAGRTVRHRLAGFVASFLALAFAALLVTVFGGLLETGIRSDVPPQRLLTAPILVTGVQTYRFTALSERDRLDNVLVGQIAEIPGVGKTVGDISFPVMPLREGRSVVTAPVEGHGWASAQLTPSRLVTGRAPTASNEVALDPQLAAQLGVQQAGVSVTVLAHGTPISLQVVGIARSATSQAPTLFVTDERAATLAAGTNTVDTVAVYPDTATPISTVAARIKAALPPGSALILTGADRGRAEFPAAAGQSSNLIPLAAATGGLLTMVAIFIIASTLALSVQLRRRQIALLRAVGATPGQLRRLVLGETFLLAVPAVGLALFPAQAAGRRLLTAFAEHGLVADRLVYHQGFIPTASGAAIAGITAIVAALIAARGAIRVRPVEALATDTTAQRWLSWPRLFFGLITLAGAVALAIVTTLVFNGPIAASTAEPSAMLWAVSLALLAPAATRPVLALLGRLAAVVAPRTGHLAMLTVSGRGARTAALITPVMLLIGLSTAMLYLQTSQTAATEHAYAEHLSADLVVSSDAGLPVDVAAQLARVPGVTAASPLITSTGFFDTPPNADAIALQGLSGSAANQVTDYPLRSGNLSELSGNTVAISAENRKRGRDIGDTVAVRLGDNASVGLKIVAVINSRRGYPTLLLPADLLAAHTSTGLADQILVATDSNADPVVVETALDKALQASAPGAQVANRSATLKSFAAQEQTGAWVTYMFIAALVIYTTVSLINTTVAATAQRRPQLRMLRLLGANRGQVVRTMTVEAIMVSVAGIVLGSLVALATLLPFDSALGVAGLPAGPVWIYLTVTGSAALVTIAVTRLSTQLLHTEPGRA